MTARVVCIIPCYNSAEFVADAVQSALTQTFADCKVVVVDDGSTDDFERAIAPFEDRALIIRQPNKGLPSARNAGLAVTDSEFVAYLDADDRWKPTKIEEQLGYLRSQPRIAMVHTAVEFIDRQGASLPLSRREPPPGDAVGLAGLIQECQVCASSVLHSREAFDGSYFCPELKACEDWDLWLRIAGRGLRFAYLPQKLTQYRMHGTNMSRDPEVMATWTLATMERLLARDIDDASRRIAIFRRGRALCELANFAYTRRDLRSATRLYWQGLAAAGRRELARFVLSGSSVLFKSATVSRMGGF